VKHFLVMLDFALIHCMLTTVCSKDSKLLFVSDGNPPTQLDEAQFNFLRKQFQVKDV